MAIEKRSPGKENQIKHPGPYIARVVSHLDPRYSGDLRVEILSNTVTGNDPNDDNQIITARYCMPFYGVNDYRSNSNNDGYKSSQQSYGMWFVPPDPGSKVLVFFAEGAISQAYWVGCVQDEYMNHMIPDGRAGSNFLQDGNEDRAGKNPPVAEYNKKQELLGNDPDKFKKPVNNDFADKLETQGLLDDTVRGTTTTSVRRNLPSTVFGVNTPGPLDKRPGAPKGKYGSNQTQVDWFRSRLGGSSLVFDDGDPNFLRKGPATNSKPEYADVEAGETDGDVTLPQNELVRIRTRSGHQILLHNTEDLIYIAHGSGDSWIEMTANGKIDVYAKDSISVHSATDININASRDINLEAGRNVNIKAKGDASTSETGRIQMEAAGNYNLIVGASGKITVATDFDLNTGGANTFTAGGTTDILSGGQHTETASQIHMNGPQAATAATATALTTSLVPGPDGVNTASIMKRVPIHEPWTHHENLDPTVRTPSDTDREI